MVGGEGHAPRRKAVQLRELARGEEMVIAEPARTGDLAAERAHGPRQAVRARDSREEEYALAAQVGFGVVSALDGRKGAQLRGARIARQLAARPPDQTVAH